MGWFATNLNAAPNSNSALAKGFRQAHLTLTEQVSDFQPYGPSRDRPAFSVAAPIMDNQEVRSGVLALQIDYAAIHDIVEDFTRLGKSGETALAQKSGQEIVYITPLRHRLAAAFKFHLQPQAKLFNNLAMRFALEVLPEAHFAVDYQGVEVVAASRYYIPLMRWGKVVKMDTAEAFAEAAHFHRWAVFSTCLALAVFILTGFLIARSIISPIRDLQLASQKLAAGWFEERISVALDDEIGDLCHAFNSMAEKLQSFYEDLENQVTERTKRLSGILESAAEAIISADEHGIITHFNQGAERIFGYQSGEALGQPLEKLLPQRYRARHRAHIQEFVASQLATQLMNPRGEIHGLRKDGN